MRRATISVTCALILLTLSACDSAKQPKTTAQAAPQPTGNLCERIRSTLTGDWKVAESKTVLALPAADRCTLTDSAQSARSIRITVSVLPVSAADAAEFRRIDELSRPEGFAKVIDGGLGPDSWAVNPAADAPWLAFRTADRLIRVAAENHGYGGFDELKSIAQTITTLPGGVPAAPPVIERPECASGTTAAEHVLGAKSVVRRDAFVDGHLFCLWGSANRAVQTRSGGFGSDAALDFMYIKDAGTSRLAHRVSVGAEGWQQPDGVLAFRTGKQTFVSIYSLPFSSMRPVPIVMLARAIEPAYER
jgi:hypothetical protein